MKNTAFPDRLVCSHCGLLMYQEDLNLEGRIHHGRKVRCKDQKKCERMRKTMKGLTR